MSQPSCGSRVRQQCVRRSHPFGKNAERTGRVFTMPLQESMSVIEIFRQPPFANHRQANRFLRVSTQVYLCGSPVPAPSFAK
jgi:hypothetical protein